MFRFTLLAFVAGFFAVLCFHQPAVGLLHAYGVIPSAPYGTAPVAPLGVPQWFSASFWGGVWGVVMLGLFTRWRVENGLWWKCGLFGAIVLTLVALLVVFPLKGRGFMPAVLPIGFIVNGAWGLGMWVFTRHLVARREAA
ncbi:hypothetical protein KGQ90_14600 [Modicisalibacter tunisiensis]|uniref:hypothetical protein n=1 Tax=Modicisalibacter tunisiensis TaxID=390637 RepID=UPI00079B4617|nr:hypothetical protein [Modicisalibacter tunisiensis]KXS36741.1 MAG: hypothetical protein AWU55_2890 [Halomonadaceae bacterium T82-2]MBZ9540154.1 hypothetical protein [Modicisalibacter tunisiensis]